LATGCPKEFVPLLHQLPLVDASSSLFGMLNSADARRNLNIRAMDLKTLVSFLPRIFPQSLQNVARVDVRDGRIETTAPIVSDSLRKARRKKQPAAPSAGTSMDAQDVIAKAQLLWAFVEELAADHYQGGWLESLQYPVVCLFDETWSVCSMWTPSEARRLGVLAADDFSDAERGLLKQLGAHFVCSAGRRQRELLGCCRAVVPAVLSRMLRDLPDCVVDAHIGHGLLRLISQILQEQGCTSVSPEILRSLPIFDTEGGRVCVALTKPDHVIGLSSEWDSLLRDYYPSRLIAFGLMKTPLHLRAGVQRWAPSRFLSFLAKDIGSLPQKVCVAFLQAIGDLPEDKSPWKRRSAECNMIISACERARLIVDDEGRRSRIPDCVAAGDVLLEEVSGHATFNFVYPPLVYQTASIHRVLVKAGAPLPSFLALFLSMELRMGISVRLQGCKHYARVMFSCRQQMPLRTCNGQPCQ
jgi:hypothetical protein